MLAGELLGDALDGLLHAVGLAAAHAQERLGLVQGRRAARRRGEVEPRLERDHALRAGDAAQPALHAGLLGEADPGPVRVVAERPGRAGADAGQTQGAAGGVHLDGAEGRARRQGQELPWLGRRVVEVAQGEQHARALAAHGKKRPGRGRRALAGPGGEIVERGLDLRGVALVEQVDAAAAVAQTVGHRLSQADLAGQPVQLAGLVRADQKGDLTGAVGQRQGEEVEPGLGHLVHVERQHRARQPASEPGDQGDHLGAVAVVVQQQDRVRAARLAIGLQERAQPVVEGVAGGELIADGAGRGRRWRKRRSRRRPERRSPPCRRRT